MNKHRSSSYAQRIHNRDKSGRHGWLRFVRTILLMLMLITIAGIPAQTYSYQPSVVQPASLSFFGMNTYITGLERINNDDDDGIATLVNLGRSAGVEWAREELSWGNLERRRKGRWEWRYFDTRLRQLSEAGYGIVGMLLTTPAWARVADCEARIQRFAAAGVTPQDYWCPPVNAQDFADYVFATVERYDGDGYNDADGSPRVAVWQIWNEPNAWETWPGSPTEYGRLLQAGYAAAKAADPSALVATGGVYVLDGSWADSIGHSDGLRFLDEMLTTVPGAWNAFDALAIHPYMPDVAPDQPGILDRVTLWGRITTTRDWLNARTQFYGGGMRPVWISEVGWSTCSPAEADCYALQTAMADTQRPAGKQDYRLLATVADPQIAATLIGKTEEQQANYMLRTHVIAMALGVQHLSYFQLEDKFDGTLGNFWEEAALLNTKAHGYRAKLAYQAYRVMTEQLAGSRYAGPGSLHTFQYDANRQQHPVARYHQRFVRYDQMLIDVVWRNSGSEDITVGLEPGRTISLLSRDGHDLPIQIQDNTARFGIGENPVYLRQALAPVLTVTPSEQKLLAQVGDNAYQIAFTIGNAGSGNIQWNVAVDASWIRPNPISGEGWQSRMVLMIDPSGLLPGAYTATVTITSNAGIQQVPIHLLVLTKLERRYFPIIK